jgi:hypothetical protein
MIQLTDNDILLKLGAFEDSFVERKTASDSSDRLDAVSWLEMCRADQSRRD